MLRIVFIAIALATFGCQACCADTVTPENAQQATCPIAEFFRGVLGEWVGVCKQSTDGKTTDDKYFNVSIRETSANNFEAKFDYYRFDTTNKFARLGGSSLKIVVASDCSATARVIGEGEVLVDNKPKKQEHDLTESLTLLSQEQLQARGEGDLKIYGMPLGIGKLGKVQDDQSSWKITNGALSIQQSLSIVFKALCFSKSFKIEADYAAVRGSDLSNLIKKQTAKTTTAGG